MKKLFTIAAVLVTVAMLATPTTAAAETDPFPGVGDGNRISGGPTLSGTRTDPINGDSLGCPTHSAPAVETWPDGRWEMYCIKRWTPQSQIDDEANVRAAEAAARTAAEAEAARNPGIQVCKTWSYTYSNGVSTASGGVCTTVPVLTEGIDVPTPVGMPAPTPPRPTNPDTSREPWYLYEPNYAPGSCALTTSVSGPGYSYTRPFSAQECAQREIDSLAWSAQSQARARAQAQATNQPGIRVCTPWSAAGQSGQECAFEPLRGADQQNVSVPVTELVADPSQITNVTPGWEQYAPNLVAGSCGLTTTQSGPGYTYTRPFSVTECSQRAIDIAADSARRQASANSEAAARRTPGVEFCTRWSAGDQNGRECRTRPIGLDDVIATSENETDLQVSEDTEPTQTAISIRQQISQSTPTVVRNQIKATVQDVAQRNFLRKYVNTVNEAIPEDVAKNRLSLPKATKGITNKWSVATAEVCTVNRNRQLTFRREGQCVISLEFTTKANGTFLLGQDVTYERV